MSRNSKVSWLTFQQFYKLTILNTFAAIVWRRQDNQINGVIIMMMSIDNADMILISSQCFGQSLA